MEKTLKFRAWSIVLLILTLAIGYFVYSTEMNPDSSFRFRLGLDLKGGTQLIYKADTSKIESARIKDSMSSLRDVIERRVNLFGVSEPIVAVEEGGIAGGSDFEHRLIVELPGITDVNQAVAQIGKTPLLDFRVQKSGIDTSKITATTSVDEVFLKTELTGRLLERAVLQFNNTTGEPIVGLEFNPEGKALFAKITKDNIGKPVAIFLDGQPISVPRVNEEIKDGKAQISGNFKIAEAKTLVRDLNYGSLPVPIELVGTQTIGATLGSSVLSAGLRAALLGFLLIAIFLIFWYRLPGFIAVISLLSYVCIVLSLFKLFGVTMTAAGIAGFILSMGIAVDANVLIFERLKEEIRRGKSLGDALLDGFSRAWSSIRDGNSSGIIASIILFWLGTSLVKGFALTLLIGILVSMFTATVVSRTYLFAVHPKTDSKLSKFLFGSGVTK